MLEQIFRIGSIFYLVMGLYYAFTGNAVVGVICIFVSMLMDCQATNMNLSKRVVALEKDVKAMGGLENESRRA